jgi:molybdopterin-guanine dinucleotide biosynthesis protein A
MSKRMGQNKADVVVRDKTMLEMVGSALSATVDKVVVLGPERPGWECWPDSFHANGPLAGIATALARANTTHVLLVAVDHPFVRIETLRHLISSAGALPVVPVDDHGIRQVTCAIYPKEIAGAAAEEVSSGGSIQSLLDRVSFDALAPEIWNEWGEDGRSWYSVDSPEALAEGLGYYG